MLWFTAWHWLPHISQPITVSCRDQPWHKECFVCIGCKQQLAGQRLTSRDNFAHCFACFCNLFAKKWAYCTSPISGIGVTPLLSQIMVYKLWLDVGIGRVWFCSWHLKKAITPLASWIVKWFRGRSNLQLTGANRQKHFPPRSYASTWILCIQLHQLQDNYISDIRRLLRWSALCSPCIFTHWLFFGVFVSGLGGSKYITFKLRQWHNDCFNCKKCNSSLVGRSFLTCRDDVLCPDCGKDFWITTERGKRSSKIITEPTLFPSCVGSSQISHFWMFLHALMMLLFICTSWSLHSKM